MTKDTPESPSQPPHPPASDRSMKEAQKLVANFIDSQLDDIVREITATNAVDVSNLQDFYLSLKSESDRGLAIVLLAYVDDVFRSVYSKMLNPKVDGGLETLLGLGGPLNSAGLRIHMAFALNWIQEETYKSLRAMQKIRNAFAHRVPVSSFEDTGIAALVDRIAPVDEKHLKPKDDMTIRQSFHVRGMFTCSRVILEMTGTPLSIRRGLSPLAHLGRGFDSMAPLQQTALLAAIEATDVIVADALG